MDSYGKIKEMITKTIHVVSSTGSQLYSRTIVDSHFFVVESNDTSAKGDQFAESVFLLTGLMSRHFSTKIFRFEKVTRELSNKIDPF